MIASRARKRVSSEEEEDDDEEEEEEEDDEEEDEDEEDEEDWDGARESMIEKCRWRRRSCGQNRRCIGSGIHRGGELFLAVKDREEENEEEEEEEEEEEYAQTFLNPSTIN